MRSGSWHNAGDCPILLLLFHHLSTRPDNWIRRTVRHWTSAIYTTQRMDHHWSLWSCVCHTSRLRNDIPQRAHIHLPTAHPDQGKMVCDVLRGYRSLLCHELFWRQRCPHGTSWRYAFRISHDTILEQPSHSWIRKKQRTTVF